MKINTEMTAGKIVGLIGCGILFLGMFLPFISLELFAYSHAMSFAAFLREECGGGGGAVFLLVLLVVAEIAVRFLEGLQKVGLAFTLLWLVIYIGVVFYLDDYLDFISIGDVASAGFWFIWIALAFLIASYFLEESGKGDLESIRQSLSFLRVESAAQWRCVRCGKQNHGNGNYCPACGERNPFKRVCPECGRPATGSDLFCGNCQAYLGPGQATLKKACPHCGRPVAVTDVFCGNCKSYLAEQRPPAKKPPQGEEAEEPAKAPTQATPPKESPDVKEPKIDTYQGVWQMGVNKQGVPSMELVITSIQEAALTFDLVKNSTYAIVSQRASISSNRLASFQTEDGSKVVGSLVFMGDRILVQIEESAFPYLSAGEEIVFDTRGEQRALAL